MPRNLSSHILKIFYLHPLFLILPPCSIQSSSSSQKPPHSTGRLLLILSKPSLHQINPFHQPPLTGPVLQPTSHSATPPRRCHLLTSFSALGRQRLDRAFCMWLNKCEAEGDNHCTDFSAARMHLCSMFNLLPTGSPNPFPQR